MSSNVFEPSCIGCGKSLGFMDVGELAALEDCSSGSGCLCFDCDPEAASTTPSIFLQWSENELFDIGDTGFQIRDGQLKVIGVSRAHAHERTRLRVLSSYTYLNRNSKNQALLSNGLVLSGCGKCRGTGELDGFVYIAECDACGGSGVLESAVIIPAWILGVGCENV
jgi:hypothetical protein